MADLISSLADSIIALINSKPGSPTKEEVDAVLRLPIETCIDAERMASYPVIRKAGWVNAITAEEIKAGDPVMIEPGRIVWMGDCQGEAPPMSVLPCPRHLDGVHTFDRPQHAYATPCVCGARKP